MFLGKPGDENLKTNVNENELNAWMGLMIYRKYIHPNTEQNAIENEQSLYKMKM